MKKSCRTCWYLSDPYTNVCVNERSVHCADYVMLDDVCPYYDEDEKKVESEGRKTDEDGNE